MKARFAVLNPGALIALVLCAMVVCSACKNHRDNPVGPDTTAKTDTTHKSDTTHVDTTITSVDIRLTNPADSLQGGIAISGDGNTVACLGSAGTTPVLYIYNSSTGALIRKISPVSGWGVQINYSGSRLLVNGTGDGYHATVYDAISGNILQDFSGLADLTTTGDSLLLINKGGTTFSLSIGLYSASTGALLNSYSNIQPYFMYYGMTKDSRYFIVSWEDSTFSEKMSLRDMQTGEKVSTYNQSVDIILATLSQDGVILGGFTHTTQTLALFNTLTGAQLSAIPLSVNDVDAFALFPDHKTMVVSHSAQYDTVAKTSIIDFGSGAVVRTLPGIPSMYPRVYRFAMSDDGSRLVGSFWDAVRVWKLK